MKQTTKLLRKISTKHSLPPQGRASRENSEKFQVDVPEETLKNSSVGRSVGQKSK